MSSVPTLHCITGWSFIFKRAFLLCRLITSSIGAVGGTGVGILPLGPSIWPRALPTYNKVSARVLSPDREVSAGDYGDFGGLAGWCWKFDGLVDSRLGSFEVEFSELDCQFDGLVALAFLRLSLHVGYGFSNSVLRN